MSCLLSFGELNIPSSRAFWDDFDEDDLPTDEPEKLQLQIVSPLNMEKAASEAKVMLVVEGLNVANFAQGALLKEATKLAIIPSKRSTLQYVENKKMLVAVIEEDLPKSGEILELLLNLIKIQDAITLTIKPKIDYKTENIDAVKEEITFLRSINSEAKCAEPLEVPNFISGVAAGIASWRIYAGLKVQSYVAYTDNVTLDATAAKPIIKLLEVLGIQCSDVYHPNNLQDCNLYT